MNKKLITNFLDYLSIVILGAIIALSPWPYGSVGISAQYYIHLASLSLLVIWLIKRNFFSKEITYYSAYTPLLCFFGLALISILYSIYRYASIIEILNWISYLTIFFIVSDTLNNEKRVNLFLWVIILTGLFYSSYGMLQYYGYLPCKFWTQPGSLASRYINGGPFGAYININIFLCLGLILFKQRIHIKIIIFGFFFLFVSALILSNSRISWLVFAFLLIIALFLFMSLTSAKTKGFAPIVIFAIIIFSACWYFGPKIWHRVIIAQTTQFQSLLQRFDVWKGTLKIILAYPFGSGLGTFQYIYPVFRTHSDRFVVDFAHSDALQLASESGIAALTLFGWFLVRVFSAVIRSLKDLQNRNKYLVLGVAFAVLSFVLQGFIDFPIRVPANAVLFFVCLGLLTSLGKRQHKIIFSRLSSILLFLFVVVCVFIFSCIFFANKYYTCAERNFKSLRWSEAFSNYSKTIKLMPIKAENYFGRGQIYFSRAKAVFGEKRLKNDRFAEFDFKKAVKLNPYYSYAYLNLASLYVDEEKQKEALAAFNKAIETNPTVGAFYYPYADYCLEHGFLGEALETYRKSLSLFINDDGSFSNRYGTIQGLFSKIYDHTSDYSQLKLVIPDKANIRLEFAYFLEQKNLFPESCSEYNDILTNYPDNKIAKAAIERLKVKCQK